MVRKLVGRLMATGLKRSRSNFPRLDSIDLNGSASTLLLIQSCPPSASVQHDIYMMPICTQPCHRINPSYPTAANKPSRWESDPPPPTNHLSEPALAPPGPPQCEQVSPPACPPGTAQHLHPSPPKPPDPTSRCQQRYQQASRRDS